MGDTTIQKADLGSFPQSPSGDLAEEWPGVAAVGFVAQAIESGAGAIGTTGGSTYVAAGPPPPSFILMPTPDEDPDETAMNQVLVLLARTAIEEFGLVPLDRVEVDYSKNLGVGRGWQNWGFGGNNNGVYRATVEGTRGPLVVKMIDDMGEDTVREIRNYAIFSLLGMGPRFYGAAFFPDRDSIGIFMEEIPNGLNTKDIYNFADIREPISHRINHQTLTDLLRARRYFDRLGVWTQDLDFLILLDGRLVLIDPAEFEFFTTRSIRHPGRSVDSDHLDFTLFYWMKPHIIRPGFLPPEEMQRVAAYLEKNREYIGRHYGDVAEVIEDLRQEGYPFPPNTTSPPIHSLTDRELEAIVSRVVSISTARIAIQQTPIPAYLEQILRHPVRVEEIPVSSGKDPAGHMTTFPFTVGGITALERKLRDHLQLTRLLSSPKNTIRDQVKLAPLRSVVLIEGKGGKIDGIGLATDDPMAEGYMDFSENPDNRAAQMIQKTMQELSLWNTPGKNPFFWREKKGGTIGLFLQPFDGEVWITHLWFRGLLEASDGNHVLSPLLAAVQDLLDQKRDNYPSAAGHPAKQRDLMRFEDANKAREWLAAMKDKNSLPSYQGDLQAPPFFSYAIGELYNVAIDGEEHIFRPFRGNRDDISTFRRMLAVSQLKELMGIKTVPSSWMARVNGQTGLVSPFPCHEYFDEEKADPDSLHEALAFQFLIGNWLGWTDFVRMDAEGQLMTGDNSYAFALGLVGKKAHDDFDFPLRRPFGVHLPERYPASFARAIRQLAPDVASDKLKDNLTNYEIDDLLFRREVVLKDIEMRELRRREVPASEEAPAQTKEPERESEEEVAVAFEKDSYEAKQEETGDGRKVGERSFLLGGAAAYAGDIPPGLTSPALRSPALIRT
ncbi:MAG: hypothetical protein HY541_08535, partial [Deltaproteobacteria bacterium]|nr:hypothetical protein [Deltaproteobacteria bacterium]